jgi:prepilin-type N-terminal cleavage/methylation domain-containing protein
MKTPVRRHSVRAFTLVELVVVIAILAILSGISFVSYSSHVTDARDSARISDIDGLKVLLKSEKQRVGAYPLPGNLFNIVNSGSANVVAKQGVFNTDVPMNNLTKYPKDPTTMGHYPYSISKNRQSYQFFTVLETASTNLSAYVDGDYKVVAKNVLPSLLLAVSVAPGSTIEIGSGITGGAGGDGSVNRRKFVINGGAANLVYNLSGVPKTNVTLTFDQLLTQSGAKLTGATTFRTCQEILESGYSAGPGEYQVLNATGAIQNVNCF